MKKHVLSIAIAASLVSTSAWAADGSDEQSASLTESSGAALVVGAEAGFYSSYYFRGAYLWQDVVAFQPSVTLGASTSIGTFAANVWASIPFSQRDELEAVRDEVDFTASWFQRFAERVVVSAGFTSYVVFQEKFHTEELWASVDVELPYGLVASGGIWGDVNEFKGVYYRAALGWSQTFAERVGVTAKVFHGGAKYEGAPFAAVEGVGTSLDVGVSVGGGVSIVAQGLYDYNPDSAGDTSLWFAGGKVAYAF